MATKAQDPNVRGIDNDEWVVDTANAACAAIKVGDLEMGFTLVCKASEGFGVVAATMKDEYWGAPAEALAKAKQAFQVAMAKR